MHQLPAIFLFLSFFPGLAIPAAAQDPVGGGVPSRLHHWQSPAKENLGDAVLGGVDLDGDGVSDLAIGAPGGSMSGGTLGRVEFRSGISGQLIRSLAGAPSFGASLAALPDLDGDGIQEVAVGEPWAFSSDGAIHVYGGGTGQLRYSLATTWPGYAETGVALASAPDLDGDGLDDFYGTSPGARLQVGPTFLGLGRVAAYSSADGRVIWEAWGPTETTGFGAAVAPIGDFDGDGVPDLVVGAPEAGNGSISLAGALFFLSGADGAELLVVPGGAYGQHYGSSLAGGGDFDGDGVDDLLVGGEILSGGDAATLWQLPEKEVGVLRGGAGTWLDDWDGDGKQEFVVSGPAHWSNPVQGESVVVFSGATQRPLLRWDGWAGIPWIHAPVPTAVGDLDDDGLDELAIVSWEAVSGFFDPQLEVFRFQPCLRSSGDRLSIATGGAVVFQADFPADAAGDLYQLLCSASGTGPSWLNGVQVPLSVDAFLLRCVLGIYPAELLRPSGFLNADGDALSFVVAAPYQLPASLVGDRFDFAFVCGPTGGPWRYSSVAVALEILP